MANGVHTLLSGIVHDPAGVARIVVIVVIVVLTLRVLARLVWGAARLLAATLTVAIALALLFGKPTRISDVSALREAAVDAARNLIN